MVHVMTVCCLNKVLHIMRRLIMISKPEYVKGSSLKVGHFVSLFLFSKNQKKTINKDRYKNKYVRSDNEGRENKLLLIFIMPCLM